MDDIGKLSLGNWYYLKRLMEKARKKTATANRSAVGKEREYLFRVLQRQEKLR